MSIIATEAFEDNSSITAGPDGSIVPHPLLNTCSELRINYKKLFLYAPQARNIVGLVSYFDISAVRETLEKLAKFSVEHEQGCTLIVKFHLDLD